MNIKKSLPALEQFFKEEGQKTEVVNHAVKRAALHIATHAAHPQELEAQELEDIGNALSFLSDIMDIIDRYEDGDD